VYSGVNVLWRLWRWRAEKRALAGLFDLDLKAHVDGFLSVVNLLKGHPLPFMARDFEDGVGQELVDVGVVIGLAFTQLPTLGELARLLRFDTFDFHLSHVVE